VLVCLLGGRPEGGEGAHLLGKIRKSRGASLEEGGRESGALCHFDTTPDRGNLGANEKRRDECTFP